MFNTGQRLPELARIVAATHAAGGRVLLDVYHSLGVFPVDVAALDVDYAVGGSYKYLRGGPGACYLYLDPRHLDGSLRTLDTGWFAKREPFAYLRPDPPVFAEGGDAFLESTPPVLPLYQARAGQVFLAAIGVARLRAHSVALQHRLVELLAHRGIEAIGGTEDRGAFVTVVDERAEAWSDALAAAGVVTDARGRYLRLCPDLLTTEGELVEAADAAARAKAAATLMIIRTTRISATTNTAASTMPAMMTWCGRMRTASRRMAWPLRMPRKLESTAWTTSTSEASRGGGILDSGSRTDIARRV